MWFEKRLARKRFTAVVWREAGGCLAWCCRAKVKDGEGKKKNATPRPRLPMGSTLAAGRGKELPWMLSLPVAESRGPQTPPPLPPIRHLKRPTSLSQWNPAKIAATATALRDRRPPFPCQTQTDSVPEAARHNGHHMPHDSVTAVAWQALGQRCPTQIGPRLPLLEP